jgi:tetratricopeptide (TPR) repeat protein
MATRQTVGGRVSPQNRGPVGAQGWRLNGVSVDGVNLAAMGIGLAVAVAYHRVFSAPYIFDDTLNVHENPSLREWWPIWLPLVPPAAAVGMVGRPFANLTLALNYAIGTEEVWGYHAANLALHGVSALVLLGIVRRTLLGPRLRERFGEQSLQVASAVSLLWALHPLQTESIAYTSQRTECLAGFCYLATLYVFVRSLDSDHPWRWRAAALVATFLGMASKETMATAPLLVLLYDRTFAAGSFAQAWRERWRLYLGFGSSWLLLGGLMLGTQQRAGSAGFGLGISWWSYALTQCRAIVTYLGLTFWPSTLVLDYGADAVTNPVHVWPQALLLGLLLAATVGALYFRPVLGFLGGSFFLLLAPTSSVVPLVTQTIAEHRMYLPLAAVLTLVVVPQVSSAAKWRALPLWIALAGALGCRTARRVQDYLDPVAIWRDAVVSYPLNPRAHINLGGALLGSGRLSEALAEYREAVRLKPDSATAQHDLASALLQAGRAKEAQEHAREAVLLAPDYALAHNGLANALLDLKQPDDAMLEYRRALEVSPDFADARCNLARALVGVGRSAEGLKEYRKCAAAKPEDASALGDQGIVLAHLGRTEEAIEVLRRALRLDPGLARLHYGLAGAYLGLGRNGEAAIEYEETVRLEPENVDAHLNLGNLLAQTGRFREAGAEYERVLRAQPQRAEVHHNLATVLLSLGQAAEARNHFRRALELNPADASARRHLSDLGSQ